MVRGRPPGSKNKSHHPDLAADPTMDTVEDTIEDSAPRQPRQRQPSPKRVLDESGKAIADTAAGLLVIATSGKPGHALQPTEAQSITTPVLRMLARRLPKFLKKIAPQTKLNPQDAADLEEIAITIGKYILRLIMLSLAEMTAQKEARQVARQQQNVRNNVATQPAPAPAPVAPAEINDMQILDLTNDRQAVPAERVGVSSNGHNPAFSVLGNDLGFGDAN